VCTSEKIEVRASQADPGFCEGEQNGNPSLFQRFFLDENEDENDQREKMSRCRTDSLTMLVVRLDPQSDEKGF
jgi:hypothetical protein